MTSRQTDTIIAALRYWQRDLAPGYIPVPLLEIAREHGLPLDLSEIDDLIEAFQFANPLGIARSVAVGGPPVLYNRTQEAWDCGYCGPRRLTIDMAYDTSCHGEECPWALAKAMIDKIDARWKG